MSRSRPTTATCCLINLAEHGGRVIDGLAKMYVQSTSATAFNANNNGTGQTATARGVRAQSSGTFDTTAAVRTSYALYADATSTRSAGANNLTNVGLYGTASGAQVNIALQTDAGNVLLNQTSGDTLIGTATSSGRLTVVATANAHGIDASQATTGQTTTAKAVVNATNTGSTTRRQALSARAA